MAVAMRAAAQTLLRNSRRHGHDIGIGVGISQGSATLGQIGFAERMDWHCQLKQAWYASSVGGAWLSAGKSLTRL